MASNSDHDLLNLPVDNHEQCEDLAVSVLIDLAMDSLAAEALICLKETALCLSGTHEASLVEISTSKAYDSNDCKAYEPNDCKAEIAKCEMKQSSSRKETLKNTITKSPKQGKRRRGWYPHKSSRAYRLVSEFGHKLIDYDIRVWWPMEQKFFRGTIAEFNTESKRHTVHYQDKDVEILNLTNECWHFAELEKLNPMLELETNQGPPRPKSRKRRRRRH